MGEWAHPDDDTSIIGPCGVWHQRYGVKCGIIMVTRGEGGGNAVGTEIGPALGLRRENEDRVAHYRSGTVDIFNLDRVDFFYNQSAPLTQFFWGDDETLRRVTRIIRMTQPDIYIGFTPTLAAGHGNHQQAGRYIWEGMQGRGRSDDVPGAADRAERAQHVAGQEGLLRRRDRPAPAARTTAADCTTGFVPAARTSTTSPASGRATTRRTCGRPATSRAARRARRRSGRRSPPRARSAYPTQSRMMQMGTIAAGCSRFGMTDDFVPFQPNVNPDGTANPLAGKDDAILYGASKPDPGGLPLGTLEYLTFSRFFNAPGTPFHGDAAPEVRRGHAAGRHGGADRARRAGRSTRPEAGRRRRRRAETTRDVHGHARRRGAAVEHELQDLGALHDRRRDRLHGRRRARRLARRGPLPPLGQLGRVRPLARRTRRPRRCRLGRSAAIQTIGARRDVHAARSTSTTGPTTPQSGTVSLDAAGRHDRRRAVQAVRAARARRRHDGQLHRLEHYTNSTLPIRPARRRASAEHERQRPHHDDLRRRRHRLRGPDARRSSRRRRSRPPRRAGARRRRGRRRVHRRGARHRPQVGAGRQHARLLAARRRLRHLRRAPAARRARTPRSRAPATTCTSSSTSATTSRPTRSSPTECVAHWLADSVEILIDPRGNASAVAAWTRRTRSSSAIFPFTNDPANTNGNGANGPCWSRDADNHQGFSTGPLAATVDDAPNAPGVQVVIDGHVGRQQRRRRRPRLRAAGGYNLEVKIPMADLPAAVDPNHMGLNITPYDEDNTAAAGTTTLRHIDHEHPPGVVDVRQRPVRPVPLGPRDAAGLHAAGRIARRRRRTPNVSHPNLDGVDSPQTIAQSARNGVPISGREPAPASRGITVSGAALGTGAVDASTSTPPARARCTCSCYDGEQGLHPVFNTSCDPATNPAPDYGLSACALTDGSIPPWSPDMSGRVVARRRKSTITAGQADDHDPARRGGVREARRRAARRWCPSQTPQDEVQAFDVPISSVTGGVGGTVPATLSLTLGAPAAFGAVHARASRRTTSRPRPRP